MKGDGSIPPTRDPLVAAHALTGSLDALAARLDEANAYGRRNRAMIWWLILSLLLHVIVTTAVISIAVRAENANDKADRNRDQQVATCLSGNDARAVQVQLWEYILNLPPTEPRSEAQKRQIKDSREYVRRSLSQRDCSRI